MGASAARLSINEGRLLMEAGIAHHDTLAARGASTELEQGENWVREDPREWRFISKFMRRLRKNPQNGNHILLGGSSDGLVASVLAEEGFVPTGLDSSTAMVQAARRRLARLGLHASFYKEDITNLDESLYPDTFAGVALLHVANCIPIAGENDDLLREAIANLSSLAPNGPFAFFMTYYREDVHTRAIGDLRDPIGHVPYYYRSMETISDIFRGVGRAIGDIEHFNARGVAGNGEFYQNDYLIAGPVIPDLRR